MRTVFLTNLAAVAGKYEQYDIFSTILDFETHNHLPLKKLQLLKTLKKTLRHYYSFISYISRVCVLQSCEETIAFFLCKRVE